MGYMKMLSLAILASPKGASTNGKPTPGFEPGTPSLRVKCSTS